MCRKTNKVAFISRQIKITPKSKMNRLINDSPLCEKDINLLLDVLAGYSYKELSNKYCKSEARIYQWKRTIFERLFEYQEQICRENQ